MLSLPGFLGGAFENWILDGEGSVFKSVSWSGPERHTLTLKLNSSISPGFEHSVTLPRLAGIRVPSNGTLENDPRMKISTDAYHGPVFSSSISRSPPIGSMTTTKLQFSEVTSDGATSIMFSFRPNMDILGSGTIVLNLPGFRGHFSDCLKPFNDSVIGAATWQSPALVLTLARTINRNESVEITFPTGSGLKLPWNGVR